MSLLQQLLCFVSFASMCTSLSLLLLNAVVTFYIVNKMCVDGLRNVEG